jgi:hypothetical protein
MSLMGTAACALAVCFAGGCADPARPGPDAAAKMPSAVGGGAAIASGSKTTAAPGQITFQAIPAENGTVSASLSWLRKQMQQYGGWPRSMTAQGEIDRVGSTALVMLTYLAAGHTEKHGSFKETIHAGMEFLKSQQGADGAISEDMFSHALATIALSEATGMTGPPEIKPVAQKAIDYLVSKQNAEGWWPRVAADDAASVPDMRVTMLAVMAIKSAKACGLTVDGAAGRKVYTYLDGHIDKETHLPVPDARDASSWGRGVRLSAAIAQMRLFMGIKPTDTQIVAAENELIEKALPEKTMTDIDPLLWWVGTMVNFQKGGEHWETWNDGMKGHMDKNRFTAAVTDAPPAPAPPSAEQKARFEQLIHQLGDDEWVKRDDAHTRLIAVGPDALPAIEAAIDDPDPEIRNRLGIIRQKITMAADMNLELYANAMRVLSLTVYYYYLPMYK